jgi:hypothetical protein
LAVAAFVTLAACVLAAQEPQKKSKATGSAARKAGLANKEQKADTAKATTADTAKTTPVEKPPETPKGSTGTNAPSSAPTEPLSLDDALKTAGAASKEIADSVKSVEGVLDQASAADAGTQAVKTSISKARDEVKAISKSQEKLSSALEAVTKAVAKPAKPTPAPFPDPNFVAGCYQLGTMQIGFFAVRFNGAFDEQTVAAAGKQGRRIVELGETLGKQRSLNRVAMKEGDKTYSNIAFGFHIKGEPVTRFIALGGSDTELFVYKGDATPIIKDDPGLIQTATFSIAGGREIKLSAVIRGEFAELLYELPDKPESPDQIQLVGSYEPVEVAPGVEPFLFYAILLRERTASHWTENTINAARQFGREVASTRGVTLSRTRHGITFLPGDRLLIVVSSADQGTEACRILTRIESGAIRAITRTAYDGTLPAALPQDKPEAVGDFVGLQLPGKIVIPVKIDRRPSYGLDFTIQWPR